MNKLLTLILAFSVGYAFGQHNSLEYSIHWKIHDTTVYRVAFEQVSKNIDDTKLDIKDKLVQTMLSKIRQELGSNPNEYKLISNISPNNGNFDVVFSINSHVIDKGTINESGGLLSQVSKNSENFYKIFFSLPDKKLKIGDKWKTNIQFQKSFRGITIMDSIRNDEGTLENVVSESGKSVAQIKIELSEKYSGRYTDKLGKTQNGIIQIFYNSLGYFDITNGKWIKIDGVAIIESDIIENRKVVMKVGLFEK